MLGGPKHDATVARSDPLQGMIGLSLTYQAAKEHDAVFCPLADRLKLGASECTGGSVSAHIENMKQFNGIFHVGFEKIFKLLLVHPFLLKKVTDFGAAGWVSSVV